MSRPEKVGKHGKNRQGALAGSNKKRNFAPPLRDNGYFKPIKPN
jgi:hypothetical protein